MKTSIQRSRDPTKFWVLVGEAMVPYLKELLAHYHIPEMCLKIALAIM